MGKSTKKTLPSVSKQLASFSRLKPNPAIKLDRSGQIIFDNATFEKSRQYLSATNRLLRLSQQSDSKKEYLNNVTIYIKKISRCNHIGIRVRSEDGAIPYNSTIGFSYDFHRSENELVLAKDNCICIRVIAGKHEPQDKAAMTRFGSFYTGDSLNYISNLKDHEQKRFRGKCIRCGLTSLAVIPIRMKKKIIGAIHLADEKPDLLTLEKIEFIESLTSVIGEGIEKFTASDGLRESEMKYRELVENANSIILRLDTAGNIVFFNEFAERFFGYKKEEIIGRNSIGTIIPKKESSGRDLGNMIKSLLKNPLKYARNENENIKKNGERAWIIWRNKALYDKEGRIEGILSVGNDNTERKVREEQLLESYKHLGTINRKISFLAELNQLTIKHKHNKKVVSERMLRPLLNFTGASFGALFKYDEEKTKTFRVLASVNAEHYTAPSNIEITAKDTRKIMKMFTCHKYCLREHCRNLPLGKLSLQKKLNYCMMIPFNWENKLKAFIFLGFESKKDFSSQDIEFLNIFSTYSAALLINTKVFK